MTLKVNFGLSGISISLSTNLPMYSLLTQFGSGKQTILQTFGEESGPEGVFWDEDTNIIFNMNHNNKF